MSRSDYQNINVGGYNATHISYSGTTPWVNLGDAGRRHDPFAVAGGDAGAGGGAAFSFGEERPLFGWGDFLDCMECADNGNWYETPISFYEIARLFETATFHQSPLFFKRNVIISCWQPHPMLSRMDAMGVVLDYLVFGNAYLEVRRNRLGAPLSVHRLPAKYMRRGKDLTQYWFVPLDTPDVSYPPGSVLHLMNPEIHQEIYGLPEYLATVMSILLDSEGTKFRWRFYTNGSHAGKLIYVNDAITDDKQVADIKKALTEAKRGNAFKNLFINIPNGKKDGIQIMPFAELTAKDDFTSIKKASRTDMLAAHRVPPQLMGVVPENDGGFGDVEKAAKVFAINELAPVMENLKSFNDLLGVPLFRFSPYALAEVGSNG
ncbi:phage portal protein [Gibbsiella dentisursi]|uniref:Phage portal protein n=1 Tax=Gibbsiella dentisursi TaxID=796890 RepID=A0ABP7M3J2_9GAMM